MKILNIEHNTKEIIFVSINVKTKMASSKKILLTEFNHYLDFIRQIVYDADIILIDKQGYGLYITDKLYQYCGGAHIVDYKSVI